MKKLIVIALASMALAGVAVANEHAAPEAQKAPKAHAKKQKKQSHPEAEKAAEAPKTEQPAAH